MVVTCPVRTRKNALSDHGNQGLGIPALTGPLDVLNGQRFLALCDEQNLYHGARKLGRWLCFRRLAGQLNRAWPSCGLRAFYARRHGDDWLGRRLIQCGWLPHPSDIEEVRTCRGYEVRRNCDNSLLLDAVELTRRYDPHIVVLATGDGDLGCDLAQRLRNTPSRPRIVVLSLPRSTSQRLTARNNPNVAANIWLGADVLLPTRCE